MVEVIIEEITTKVTTPVEDRDMEDQHIVEIGEEDNMKEVVGIMREVVEGITTSISSKITIVEEEDIKQKSNIRKENGNKKNKKRIRWRKMDLR